jgi:hypothetical protein
VPPTTAHNSETFLHCCHPQPPPSRKVNLRNLSGHSLSPSYLQWTCLCHHFSPSSSFISYTKQIAKLSSSSLELFLFKDHFRPPRHRILKTNVRFHLIYETHQFILWMKKFEFLTGDFPAIFQPP